MLVDVRSSSHLGKQARTLFHRYLDQPGDCSSIVLEKSNRPCYCVLLPNDFCRDDRRCVDEVKR